MTTYQNLSAGNCFEPPSSESRKRYMQERLNMTDNIRCNFSKNHTSSIQAFTKVIQKP